MRLLEPRELSGYEYILRAEALLEFYDVFTDEVMKLQLARYVFGYMRACNLKSESGPYNIIAQEIKQIVDANIGPAIPIVREKLSGYVRDCPICLEAIVHPISGIGFSFGPCGQYQHTFHKTCLDRHNELTRQNNRRYFCPMCRGNNSSNKFPVLTHDNVYFLKIEALLGLSQLVSSLCPLIQQGILKHLRSVKFVQHRPIATDRLTAIGNIKQFLKDSHGVYACYLYVIVKELKKLELEPSWLAQPVNPYLYSDSDSDSDSDLDSGSDSDVEFDPRTGLIMPDSWIRALRSQ